jgi:hypothetical protein
LVGDTNLLMEVGDGKAGGLEDNVLPAQAW